MHVGLNTKRKKRSGLLLAYMYLYHPRPTERRPWRLCCLRRSPCCRSREMLPACAARDCCVCLPKSVDLLEVRGPLFERPAVVQITVRGEPATMWSPMFFCWSRVAWLSAVRTRAPAWSPIFPKRALRSEVLRFMSFFITSRFYKLSSDRRSRHLWKLPPRRPPNRMHVAELCGDGRTTRWQSRGTRVTSALLPIPLGGGVTKRPCIPFGFGVL